MTRSRETYFTPGTVVSKAREMLQALADGHPCRPPFEPGRSALLVLDLQRYFLDASSHAFVPSAPAILPGINTLIQACSRHNLPVFLSRHLNTPTNAGLMASWWRDLLTEENPMSHFDARLDTAAGIEIQKSRYDAFFDTPLEMLLRERGIDQVIIGGVMTHLCCETTARSAFMRGFETFFLADGVATYSEAFHRASLLTLAHGFATPLLVSDVLRVLEGHA